MLSYIKNYSIINIKFKLSFLYLLNVSDIILTLLLIKSGYFVEANPFMASIIELPLQLTLLKIILPALLLSYIYFRMKKAKKHQLIISNNIINGALFGYGFLNLLHIFWFINLIFLS